MIKRILNTAAWLGIVLYMFIAFSFSNRKEEEKVCKGVKIFIEDSLENHFVTGNLIKKTLADSNIVLSGNSLSSLDLSRIESVIASIKAVKELKVYSDYDSLVYISVQQYKPLMRIASDEGFYLDEKGQILKSTPNNPIRLMVATGNVTEEFACEKLFPLALYVSEDPFLEKLIEQIYVDPEQEIILVPKIGSLKIVFGVAEDIPDKFRRLKAMYLRAFPEVGFDKYKSINLSFKNQVVAEKI